MKRFALLLLLAACGSQTEIEPQPTRARPLVAVTFYPNEYLAQRIGGDAIDVYCDVPETADALFWIPNDEELQRMHAADLILLQGAGLERWVERALLPTSRVVVAAEKLTSRFLYLDAGSKHSHGSGETHEAGGVDPHIWLDPENAKHQARVIASRLVELLPEHESAIEARYAELAEELDELSVGLREIAARGESLCASHPAYDYLASRYGLEIHNFDFDPEVMPSEEALAELSATKVRTNAFTILWESAPKDEIAKRLRDEFGLESLVFSPCELLGNEERALGEDYLSVQRANLDRLR